MGMGEPLANYPRLHRALTIMTAEWGMGISPRRITVSTVGLVPSMDRLLADFPVHLAVSLHATTDEVRDRIAPINKRYPLTRPDRRVQGVADRATAADHVRVCDARRRQRFARRCAPAGEDARATAGESQSDLSSIHFRVRRFAPSSRARVEAFQAILHRGNLTATIRESRGRDIAAACGQLYAERDSAASRRSDG